MSYCCYYPNYSYGCYNPCYPFYNQGYPFYNQCFPNYNACNPCANQCVNPCANSCVNPCANLCANPCANPNSNLCANLCQPICPAPLPAITYITSAPIGTAIPSGPVGIPPVPIPIGSTTIPAGTVTPITGFTGTPITNVGGITVNPSTGQFTVPIAARYLISAYVTFDAPVGFGSIGTREVYIYKIDAVTGVISLLASDSRNAAVTGPTRVTITTQAQLNANDRIFFAATQNSGTTIMTTTDNRFSISRIC